MRESNVQEMGRDEGGAERERQREKRLSGLKFTLTHLVSLPFSFPFPPSPLLSPFLSFTPSPVPLLRTPTFFPVPPFPMPPISYQPEPKHVHALNASIERNGAMRVEGDKDLEIVQSFEKILGECCGCGCDYNTLLTCRVHVLCTRRPWVVCVVAPCVTCGSRVCRAHRVPPCTHDYSVRYSYVRAVVRCTLYAVHCTLYAVRCTLYTAHVGASLLVF